MLHVNENETIVPESYNFHKFSIDLEIKEKETIHHKEFVSIYDIH